jgi:ferredoxin
MARVEFKDMIHFADEITGSHKLFEGLELWELVEDEGGKKKARVIEEAGIVCNCCGFCRDACPEAAIIIIDE